MKTIKRLKNNCVSKIYVRENASNFVLIPRGDMVPSTKIIKFSLFSRFIFDKLQWIIPVTAKSLSELREGRLKFCATAKPVKLFRTERMCSVILSANRRSAYPM